MRKKSLKFWALSGSVIIHIVVLSCFAVINFSKYEDKSEPRRKVSAEFKAVGEYVQSQPVVKKPEFKTLKSSATRIYKLEKSGEKRYAVRSHSRRGESSDSPEPSGVTADRLETGKLAESKVSFFNSTAYTRKVCYLVDCSGSMKGIFSSVREKLEQSVRELRQDQFFEIMFFNKDVTGFSSGTLTRASEVSKRKAIRFVGIIEPAGTTDALGALEEALRVRDAEGNCVQVIYFLTDGFELSGEQAESFNQAVDRLLGRTSRDVQINVIAFYPQQGDRAVLARLARKGNGEMIVIER